MPGLLLALVALLATPPAPTRWVEDHAAFLSVPTRLALDTKLEAYQRATGHQVIVWIDKTLGGEPLDDWSVRTFAAWKIGRKGIDDGLAMFIFADDRKIDIEVGYGIEDKVPDAIASRIIREVMAPKLQSGDRDGAVTAGVDAVLSAIEGRPWTPTATPAPRAPSWTDLVVGGVLGIVLLVLLITHPRAALWFVWSLIAGGRWGGGGGWGGGEGGSGGFSGGGGRSGGGGARGGW